MCNLDELQARRVAIERVQAVLGELLKLDSPEAQSVHAAEIFQLLEDLLTVIRLKEQAQQG